MKLEQITWMTSQKRKQKSVKRNYDVRVSLNRSGENKSVIRFGFLNQGARVFAKSKYIEVSDVVKLPNRIYFRVFDEKVNPNVHALSNNFNSRSKNLYTSITPSEKAEKIYRMNWITRTYTLKFDEECSLYYIENSKESE